MPLRMLTLRRIELTVEIANSSGQRGGRIQGNGPGEVADWAHRNSDARGVISARHSWIGRRRRKLHRRRRHVGWRRILIQSEVTQAGVDAESHIPISTRRECDGKNYRR